MTADHAREKAVPTSDNNDDFIVPSKHLKVAARRMKRKTAVMGKAKTSVNSLRGAPEPKRDLFVFRLDSQTSKLDIENHMKNIEIETCDIELVSHPNAKFKSFKMSVGVSNVQKALDENVWPEGVGIRRYWRPRNENVNGD